MSKKAKRRDAMAASLAASAELFYPERSGQFLCPTCLTWIPLSDRNNITDGHIIPQAAGGRLTTVICRKRCNSPFGYKRDKWLGEYIKLIRKPQPHMLNADEQLGYFEIDGVRVSGRFQIAESGEVQFFIFKNLSSPKALATLEERFQSPVGKRPPKWSLTYPAPRLFRNVDAVEVGFITAAYLMWFRELGYSWALQHHLDVVRRQILTETLTILSRSASVVITSGKRDEPSIGVTHIDGELALVCGIENRLVFFPPADAPELYDRLPSSMNGKSSEIHAFTFSSELRRSLREQGPFGVIFENRVIVWPDVLLKGGYPLLALSREGPPRLLAPISSENFERLKQLYPTQGRTIEPNIRSPERDTGR